MSLTLLAKATENISVPLSPLILSLGQKTGGPEFHRTFLRHQGLLPLLSGPTIIFCWGISSITNPLTLLRTICRVCYTFGLIFAHNRWKWVFLRHGFSQDRDYPDYGQRFLLFCANIQGCPVVIWLNNRLYVMYCPLAANAEVCRRKEWTAALLKHPHILPYIIFQQNYSKHCLADPSCLKLLNAVICSLKGSRQKLVELLRHPPMVSKIRTTAEERLALIPML